MGITVRPWKKEDRRRFKRLENEQAKEHALEKIHQKVNKNKEENEDEWTGRNY